MCDFKDDRTEKLQLSQLGPTIHSDKLSYAFFRNEHVFRLKPFVVNANPHFMPKALDIVPCTNIII